MAKGFNTSFLTGLWSAGTVVAAVYFVDFSSGFFLSNPPDQKDAAELALREEELEALARLNAEYESQRVSLLESQEASAALMEYQAAALAERATEVERLRSEVEELEKDVEERLKPFINQLSLVRVPYATNRAVSEELLEVDFDSYSFERGELSYGIAVVSVPKSSPGGRLAGELSSLSWLEGILYSRNPATDVTAQTLTRLSKDEFTNLLRNQSSPAENPALLFIHGFNTDFEEAMLRTGQLAYDLQFPGPVVSFSWPSAGRVTAYGRDRTRAEGSVSKLVEVLTLVAADPEVDRVFVVAHSMGGYILSRALEVLASSPDELRTKFQQIILAAPDIDAELFREEIAPQVLPDRLPLTVYSSSRDVPLALSRAFNGYPRLGDISEYSTPLEGMHLIDASSIVSDFKNHSYFGDSASVLSDIYFTIVQGLSDPDDRFLERVEGPEVPLWRFKSQ